MHRSLATTTTQRPLKLVPLPFSFVWRTALDLTWQARPLLVEQPRNLCNRAPGHRASDKKVRHSVSRGANSRNTIVGERVGLNHWQGRIDRKEVGTPGEFAELENMNADQLRAFSQRAARC